MLLCLGGLGGCLSASQPSASRDSLPEGIDLSGVAAWHHRGTELEASVVAAGARFPEGLTTAELRGARVYLVHSGLSFQSTQATVDLERLEGEGSGEVILEGRGFRATGGRFEIHSEGRTLEITDPVRVETPGA